MPSLLRIAMVGLLVLLALPAHATPVELLLRARTDGLAPGIFAPGLEAELRLAFETSAPPHPDAPRTYVGALVGLTLSIPAAGADLATSGGAADLQVTNNARFSALCTPIPCTPFSFDSLSSTYLGPLAGSLADGTTLGFVLSIWDNDHTNPRMLSSTAVPTSLPAFDGVTLRIIGDETTWITLVPEPGPAALLLTAVVASRRPRRRGALRVGRERIGMAPIRGHR